MGYSTTNPAAPAKSVEAYGSMATQTGESLKRIWDILKDMGLGMGGGATVQGPAGWWKLRL
ncbi:hypothetical protein PY793_12230 [Acetobacter fabarum]|uniref:hypothetical protein n=1 Tax=Acetobacter fabarum TaxID=483199 RepID=UPI00312B9474